MVHYNIEELKAHFGKQEFTGKDLAVHLGMPDYRGSGAVLKSLRRVGYIQQTVRGWRFEESSIAEAQQAKPIAAEIIAQPHVARIGGYYMSENAVLIADVMQDGKVTLFTPILEIDGETKHPRNKKIIFTQQHAPTEYRALLTWLDTLAGNPVAPANDAERDTALQLADEATQKLIAAEKKIADLQAKLDGIKIAMNGALL